MKKFIAAVLLLALAASVVLHFFFYYSIPVILFHFILLAGIMLLTWLVYKYLQRIGDERVRKFAIHSFCYSLFLSLSIFYLVTIGSNFFWGKGIELRLLVNYLPSISDLIRSLPVQGWIAYAFLILFFVAVTVVYRLVKPSTERLHPSSLKKDFLIAGVLVLLVIVFYKPLIKFKRYVHDQGEPLTEFLFPKMFHSKEEMAHYGQTLIGRGIDDRACIEAVKKEGVSDVSLNVVLIVVDALRNDFLSAYGYDRETSPFLDSMVRSQSIIRIPHAFSLATSTVAGMANIFNSRDFKEFSFSDLNLMKFLKMKNYKTYAFLTGQHLNWYGLANIYKNDCDFFYESKTSLFKSSDNDLVTLKKIESTGLDHPFFAYVHLLSAHTSGVKNEAFNKFLPNKIGLNVSKKEALINNYCNGILQADYVIKQIFARLHQTDQLKNTIVVITSDHGNLFGEEGRWEHAGSVHPYIQSVPLFIYDPQPEWYQNTYSTTLLDIAPTLADRLKYNIPDCWKGRSLHTPLTDYEAHAASSTETEFPFGLIKNTDSTIVFEEMNAQKKVIHEYRIRGNTAKWEKIR